MQSVFWLSVLGSLYSHAVYPLLLLLLPRRSWRRTPLPSRFTIIVTAYNEEQRIGRKLENTLGLRGAERAEIVVASDCSTDKTDEIVASFAARGVRLIRSPRRAGKEAAQRLAVEQTGGEYIVFSDVSTLLPEDALGQILSNFADETVGAVSSVDRLVTTAGETVGEGLYVRYEMWLRDLESRVGSLVGLSGSFFAVRRQVCGDWEDAVPSDFSTALSCVRLGFRAVLDRASIGIYGDVRNPRSEYQRKLRTIVRGMSGLAARRDVLNPIRYGFFSFQVFSHKLMRWATPWFLLGAATSVPFLWSEGWIYQFALLAQIAFYGSAVLARRFERARAIAFARVASYFLETSLAAAYAAILVARGKRIVAWEPSSR